MPTVFTLVTGASSGIGREVAIQLAPARRLILSGRDEGRLEETRKLCASPDRHLIWKFDLSDVQSIEAALSDWLAEQECAVDAFVHSAGVVRILPVRMLDFGQVQAHFNTNLFAAIEITRLLVKKKVNGDALRRLVYISSAASLIGEKGNSVYAATKGALNSFAKSLAVELAPAVNVNCVLPGLVMTAMAKASFPDPSGLETIAQKYPAGIGQPRDVAAMVEFLLSQDAGWITGQNFIVDGGRTCV